MKVEWVTLDSILEPRRDEVKVEPGKRYRNVGVLNRGRGLFDKPDLTAETTNYKRLFRLNNGDLVYSKLFGWEGAVATVDRAFAGSFVSTEFPVFSIDDCAVDRRYMAHVIRWEGFVAQLADATSGLGQRRQRVNPSRFISTRIPLPALHDQRRIAAHLDRLGGTTSLDCSPARAAVESLLKGAPWSAAVRDVVYLDQREVRVDPQSTYRLIGVYGAGRGVIDRGPLSGSSTAYTTLRSVKAGQIVMSRLKAFEGAVAVVPPHLSGAVISQEFPTFTVKDAVDPGFVDAVLRSRRFQQQMASASVGIGARRERLSAESFLDLLIPDLAVPDQQRVGRMQERVRRAEALSDRGQRLAAALLPAARNKIFGAMR